MSGAGFYSLADQPQAGAWYMVARGGQVMPARQAMTLYPAPGVIHTQRKHAELGSH